MEKLNFVLFPKEFHSKFLKLLDSSKRELNFDFSIPNWIYYCYTLEIPKKWWKKFQAILEFENFWFEKIKCYSLSILFFVKFS
jgi:hypothetical protein